MSNVCSCVFVEDRERKEMIFLGRKVIVTYFDDCGHFSSCSGVLFDVDNVAIYLKSDTTEMIVFFAFKDIIDIRLTD